MKDRRLVSDQLYTGSVAHENKDACLPTKKTKDTDKPIASLGVDPSGNAHRAVQALWKSEVQMCRRAGARSEVLLVRKQTGDSTRNGLCSLVLPRPGHRVLGQQPSCTENPRGDLRNQSRADAPQTASVKEACERRFDTGVQRVSLITIIDGKGKVFCQGM